MLLDCEMFKAFELGGSKHNAIPTIQKWAQYSWVYRYFQNPTPSQTGIQLLENLLLRLVSLVIAGVGGKKALGGFDLQAGGTSTAHQQESVQKPEAQALGGAGDASFPFPSRRHPLHENQGCGQVCPEEDTPHTSLCMQHPPIMLVAVSLRRWKRKHRVARKCREYKQARLFSLERSSTVSRLPPCSLPSHHTWQKTFLMLHNPPCF